MITRDDRDRVVPYVYQEYPRLLYKGVDRLMVQNDDERDTALADGWTLKEGEIAESSEPAKRGPGRPKKVAE